MSSFDIHKFKYILGNEKYKELNNYIAHGVTTTYAHCIDVAKECIKIVERFNINVDKDELVESALLHDLYFYDWHHAPKEVGLHGFTHSRLAANNAKKIFNVSDRIYANILSHMWPLNITKVPRTKEGFIVCIADKICSLRETLNIK